MKTMKNEEKKKKKILNFLEHSGRAQSAYRIEKGTGIFWKDVRPLLHELLEGGRIGNVETSAGVFYFFKCNENTNN